MYNHGPLLATSHFGSTIGIWETASVEGTKMKDKTKASVGSLLCGAALLAVAGSVQATSMSVGDPFVGHSWDQSWSETLPGGFDTLKATITSATGTFELPGLISNSAGWAVNSPTLISVSASGALVTTLQFTTRFNDTPGTFSSANPLDVAFVFSSSDGSSERADWEWNGSVWTASTADGVSPVPDAGLSLLLLGMGILGIGAFRKMVT